MLLPDGYTKIPAGKIAAVVTCLEMRTAPALRAERLDPPWQLRRVAPVDSAWYRELFARIGEPWLWFSRLAMPKLQLEAILHDPAVHIWSLSQDGRDEGLLELDFRGSKECELAFFGLTEHMLGTGAGRWLMNRAIEYAWAKPIERFWVHTCTLDHPGALGFYLRSGFYAYERLLEIGDDPRISGVAQRSAAAAIPIIE
jgi:GNAT superfamily N-acetyltransferase